MYNQRIVNLSFGNDSEKKMELHTFKSSWFTKLIKENVSLSLFTTLARIEVESMTSISEFFRYGKVYEKCQNEIVLGIQEHFLILVLFI